MLPPANLEFEPKKPEELTIAFLEPMGVIPIFWPSLAYIEVPESIDVIIALYDGKLYLDIFFLVADITVMFVSPVFLAVNAPPALIF